MRILIIVILAIFCFEKDAYSQNKISGPVKWATQGTEWHYNLPGYNSLSGGYQFLKFSSENEVLIQNKLCNSIGIYLNGDAHIGTEYLYQNSDSVFYYNNHSKSFHLLYNFNAKLGDTIVVHDSKFLGTKAYFPPYNSEDSIGNFTYKIVDIDSVKLDGVILRRQRVEPLKYGEWFFYLGNAMSSPSYIIEGIGSLQYFFGLSPFITPESISPILRCYQSETINYKNEAWIWPCNYIGETSLVGVRQTDECKISNRINDDSFNISSSIGITQVRVYDSNGRIKYLKNYDNPSLELRIDGEFSGVYLVLVMTKLKTFNFKILKL